MNIIKNINNIELKYEEDYKYKNYNICDNIILNSLYDKNYNSDTLSDLLNGGNATTIFNEDKISIENGEDVYKSSFDENDINLYGGIKKSKYPKITDDEFYDKINNIYKDFKIPKKKRSFEEICFPKKYQLQLPQQFMSEFLNPNTPYKGVLIYHRIGAGKTCTAIRIAEKWKKYRKIIVVLPASLKGNFRGELRSLCANENYLKNSERKKLQEIDPSEEEYKEIIAKSDERINKVYKIYSYNKFIELSQNKEINLNNTLLIIDEIQNMISEKGTYYYVLYDMIHNAPNSLRTVLLSATPMFDKPDELALTMNLLRIPNPFPTGRDFYKKYVKTIKRSDGVYYHKVQNIDSFKENIKGYVSYFRGAPPYVFPQVYVKYVNCEMSDFQYKAYTDVLKNEEKEYLEYKRITMSRAMAMKSLSVKNLPNNFFIGTRVVSNVVFPNRKIGEEGFKSFRGKAVTENLEIYSIKFHKIMKKISKTKGKIFVYSGFKEYGGLKSFAKVLDLFGYKNYVNHGSGKKRYAIWSGDEDIKTKDEIKAIFNKKDNLNGSKLKVLLGSSAIKEGVSLIAVKQVHVIEPYWNQSRLDQVIGRASRFCSHKDVPEEERYVNVYIYIATRHDCEEKTVDQYIQHLAAQKNKLVHEFEVAVKESAIDCALNKNANVYEGEDDIICEEIKKNNKN